MKRHFILFLILSAVLFQSCQGGGGATEQDSLVLADASMENIIFEAAGGSRSVSFTSTGGWNAAFQKEPEGSWCRVEPVAGASGKNSVTVTAAVNDTPDERVAALVLSTGSSAKTITVSQKAGNAITMDGDLIEFDAEGGVKTLTVKAPGKVQAAVSDNAKDWLSVISTKSVSTEITLSAEGNDSYDPREGTVSISTSDGLSDVVTVRQGGIIPFITLSRNEAAFTSDGGSFTVDITANVAIDIDLQAYWISDVTEGSQEASTRTFTVQSNPSIHERTAEIVFSNKGFGIREVLTVTQEGSPDPTSIKILAIGNSFSDDALEYLYPMLEQAGYGTIKLGNLYIGGCTLQTHASNIASGSKAYDYRVNTDGRWVTTSKYSSVDAIKSEDWDYISMQQASGSSGVSSTYDPYLNNLIVKVKELCPKATLIWHMTWAYQGNSSHSEFPKYNRDQMTMYNAIVSTVKEKVLTREEIKMVIPDGTTIQNLRTSLFGDNLTRDGYHLSYDVGRFAAAMTWAKMISGCDLAAISWRPSGRVYTENQVKAIKEAVDNACAKPFEVTESTVKKDEGNPNESVEAVLKAAGFNPQEYRKLDLDIKTVAYYNSSNGNANINTNMRNYAATRIFEKAEIPNGSVIVQKAGFQYRPEAWTALNVKTNPRPEVVSAQVVVVDDAWWKDYNYRAFNLSRSGSPVLSDEQQEELKTAFAIFVPKG